MKIHENQSESKLSDHDMTYIDIEIPTTRGNARKKEVVLKTDKNSIVGLTMQDLKLAVRNLLAVSHGSVSMGPLSPSYPAKADRGNFSVHHLLFPLGS